LKYIDFVDLNYKPKETDLLCKFRLEPLHQQFDLIAGGVAAESSIGTWTELSTEQPYMRDKAAKVYRRGKQYRDCLSS
jgi:ribulose-bisphosphate carboxylase large chain